MEKIGREKLVSKIVCVALAIILWLFVLYQENPSTTKTVRNVPLVITGEQALNENGFAVYSISEKSVDISVTAKRLSLSRISSKTLSAGINVSSIRKSGVYSLPATVSAAIDANASYYVKGKDIEVVIEPIEKTKIKIEADISSPVEPSLIVDSYELSKEKVTVTAPQSVIKDIAAVKTEEFVPEKGTKEYTARLVVYGKNGNVLSAARCTPEEIKITYSLSTTKDVPITLSTSDGKTHALPSEYIVKIFGSGEEFDKIDKIETQSINLDKYKKGETLTVKLNIPKDVGLVDDLKEVEIILDEKFFD